MWLNVKKEEMYALKTDAEISKIFIIAAKYVVKRKKIKTYAAKYEAKMSEFSYLAA